MKPPQPGKEFIIVCPKCKTKQRWQYEGIDSHCKPVLVPKGLMIEKPAIVPDPPTPVKFDTPAYPVPGRLVRVKNGLFLRNEVYNLLPGENTIGQRDSVKPSMVEIDDKFMSRQSARIDVTVDKMGYRFRFTLVKSLNPAYFNGREVKAGFSKPLDFGDTFSLGATNFIFEGINGSRKPIK